jgi:hypothetical protein
MTDAGTEDDFSHTSEVAAISEEMLEATAARPQRASEVAATAGLDQTSMNPAGGVPPGDDEEVVLADDLADLIEVDDHEIEEHVPEGESTDEDEKPKRKSSVPPPLPHR